MTNDEWGQIVGESEMAETIGDIALMAKFIRELGDRWREVRGEFYAKLPRELVDLLDAAADVLRCETPGCLNLPIPQEHDFCDACTEKARETKKHLRAIPSLRKAKGVMP